MVIRINIDKFKEVCKNAKSKQDAYNQLGNLILLCPNCHALTENFKSKNIKHYQIN